LYFIYVLLDICEKYIIDNLDIYELFVYKPYK